MKIKTVSYSMLRKTSNYENDRAEVVVELEKGDTFESATLRAKQLCETALVLKSPDDTTVDAVQSALRKKGNYLSLAQVRDAIAVVREAL